MKVASLTTAAPSTTIEQSLAKIGVVYKFALAAPYTTDLALTKWKGLQNKIDISVVTGNGNVNLAVGCGLKKLAEIAAADLSNVVILPSLTANFAEAHFTIDVTAGGSLNLGSNFMSVAVSGISASEQLDIYAVNVPFDADFLIKNDAIKIFANTVKTVEMIDASAVIFDEKVTKIDLTFSDGRRVTYDTKEVFLIMAESNQLTVNISGITHLITDSYVLPVASVVSADFYTSADTEIIVTRVI